MYVWGLVNRCFLADLSEKEYRERGQWWTSGDGNTSLNIAVQIVMNGNITSKICFEFHVEFGKTRCGSDPRHRCISSRDGSCVLVCSNSFFETCVIVDGLRLSLSNFSLVIPRPL